MSQTRLCRLSIFLIIFLKLHLAFQRLNHLPRLKDVRSLSLTSVFLLSRSWTWSRVCHFLRVTYSVASQPQPRLPGSVLKLTSKVIACLFSLKIQEAIYLYYILQFFFKKKLLISLTILVIWINLLRTLWLQENAQKPRHTVLTVKWKLGCF